MNPILITKRRVLIEKECLTNSIMDCVLENLLNNSSVYKFKHSDIFYFMFNKEPLLEINCDQNRMYVSSTVIANFYNLKIISYKFKDVVRNYLTNRFAYMMKVEKVRITTVTITDGSSLPHPDFVEINSYRL